MKELLLKEIQIEETKMLKKTIQFLEQYNIKYYIIGGTFLGAVRHKGFIPWDDDIDLCIPRRDYERLIILLEKNECKIENNLEAIGYELKRDNWPFIKIINKNIKVLTEIGHDKNLWIDIFPLDNIPEKSKIYFNKVLKMKRTYFRKYESDTNYFHEYDSKKKRFLKKIMRIYYKLLTIDKIVERYIKLSKRYNDDSCDYVYTNIWGDNDKAKIKKSELVDCTYEFEGLKVNGMKDYDSILTRQYGNYMELPPVEKRVTHNFEAWRVEDDNKENKE